MTLTLYRVSDLLMDYCESIEGHLFEQACSLFDFDPTVTLRDLADTCLIGRPCRKRNADNRRRSAPTARCLTAADSAAIRVPVWAALPNGTPCSRCRSRRARRTAHWWSCTPTSSMRKNWSTDVTRTDPEAVFRSLKSVLRPRPIRNCKEWCVEGSPFISGLACQCVQAIRKPPHRVGRRNSRETVRTVPAPMARATTSFRRTDVPGPACPQVGNGRTRTGLEICRHGTEPTSEECEEGHNWAGVGTRSASCWIRPLQPVSTPMPPWRLVEDGPSQPHHAADA